MSKGIGVFGGHAGRARKSLLTVAIATALASATQAGMAAGPARLERTARVTTATYTVTNLNDSGAGSLRQAIIDATGDNAPDVIDFDPALFSGGPQTLTLTSGELDVSGVGDNDAFTVIGPGADLLTISGNNSSRIFAAVHDHNDHTFTGSNSSSLTLSSMTLANGDFAYGSVSYDGYGGGAVTAEQSGSLTLDHVVISNSQATGDGVTGGGGVYFYDSSASFTLTDSTVSSNSATHVSSYGGGSYGGGMDVGAGFINITRSTIANNASSRMGGGARLHAGSSLTVVNATFSGNTSGSSANGLGGGAGLDFSGNSATASVINSTFVNNAFNGNAGDATMGGGALRIRTATVTLQNNLITGNSSSNAGNNAILLSTSGVANGGPNIITGSVGTYSGTSANNLTGTITSVSGVGALADNGGAVRTVSIASTSNAVDAGSNAGAPADDARGWARDSAVDIGAFEYGATPPVTNAAPVIGNLDGDSASFVEDGSPIPLDSGTSATVSDSDSADFDGGNVTVSIVANRVAAEDVLGIQNQGGGAGQIGVSGGNVSYGGTLIGTVAGGSGTSDLVVTLNSSATPAASTALLRALTYSDNNTSMPNTAVRTVRVTVNDGDGGTSANADVSIAVTPVNDAPTLTATGASTTYNEGAANVSLFSSASVSTVETGQSIDSLTLTVSNVVDGLSELLNVDGDSLSLTNGNSAVTSTNALDVSVSVSGSTATVTVSKGAGIAAATAQNLVNGLSYRNDSDNPTAGNRVFTLTSIRDSGGTANGGTDTSGLSISATVNVNPINDPPVVMTSGSTTAFVEGQNVASTPVTVDGGLTVSDVDNATLASATLAIGAGFQSSEDGLAFSNNGSTMGNIAGSYNAATGTLTLTSSGATATLAQWQSALRSVTYTDSSDSPDTATRSIVFSVNDGSVDSATAIKGVSVQAVNDAPVNQVPGAQNVAQNGSLVFSPGNGNAVGVGDADAGSGSLRVTLGVAHGTLTLGTTAGLGFVSGSDGSASMSFTATLSALNSALSGMTYAPDAGYFGSDTLQISSDDQGNSGTGGAQSDSDSIAISVNATDPAVTGVSSSAANGSYKVGDVIDVAVTFDHVVNVVTTGGTPSLLLETGSTDESAAYVSGSGSNTLVFRYTVQSGDQSGDLNYQSTAALSLNGGTIRSAAGNDAVLTLPALAAATSLAGNKDLVIDGVAPLVTSVSVPANGTYTAGQNLDFTVNYSESVTVDTAGGTPRLAITLDDGSTVYADYLSGSGSTALAFRHTVLGGESDTDGIVLGGSLDMHGGSVQDAAGNAADLALTGTPSTAGVLIDAQAPTVTAVGVPGPGYYVTGNSLNFSIQFSEPVTVGPGGTPRLALDIGGMTVYADYASGSDSSTLQFSYTVQAAEHDMDGIGVGPFDLNGSTLRDGAGNDAVTALGTVPSTARVLVNALPTNVAVPAGGWPSWLLAVLSLLAAGLGGLSPRFRAGRDRPDPR